MRADLQERIDRLTLKLEHAEESLQDITAGGGLMGAEAASMREKLAEAEQRLQVRWVWGIKCYH